MLAFCEHMLKVTPLNICLFLCFVLFRIAAGAVWPLEKRSFEIKDIFISWDSLNYFTAFKPMWFAIVARVYVGNTIFPFKWLKLT